MVITMKKTKQIFSALLAAALVLGLAAFGQTAHAAPEGSEVASTAAGQVRGTQADNGTYRFLGVPYAQAEERFVTAGPVEPWEGVRDADSYGDISPQGALFDGTGGGEQPGTSNNCQNLNIWTPAGNDGGKRPVMVWLHGGGFSSGSGNDAGYDGANLSKNGDVVVVTVNHRLNLFGFLDLSAYGEKYAGSGNAGLSDIVAALEWIQDNIEAFGGDPDNVTVFGQSGGGAKVLALMTAPAAKGLFHKGIVQSGATETMGVTFASQEASAKLTENMLAELDITADNIEDIQTVSEADLQAASAAALQATAEEFHIPAALGEGYQMEWGPVVDGEYLPTDPVTAESFAEAGAEQSGVGVAVDVDEARRQKAAPAIDDMGGLRAAEPPHAGDDPAGEGGVAGDRRSAGAVQNADVLNQVVEHSTSPGCFRYDMAVRKVPALPAGPLARRFSVSPAATMAGPVSHLPAPVIP